jgi:hypothetical protein
LLGLLVGLGEHLGAQQTTVFGAHGSSYVGHVRLVQISPACGVLATAYNANG